MKRSTWFGTVFSLLLVSVMYFSDLAQAQPRVLVFTKTAGFRHDNIAKGISSLGQMGRTSGFQVVATEDPSEFSASKLSKYAAVVFFNTTGDVLDETQQDAFKSYVEGGGGYVGIHAASDTEYSWPWYGEELVGTYFDSHGAIQSGRVVVGDSSHPATQSLPLEWVRTDEWYNFRTNPRGKAHILLTLDEASVSGANMGADHPISWYRNVGSGRSWYTGLGHTAESFDEPSFQKHLVGGILWAAGVKP